MLSPARLVDDHVDGLVGVCECVLEDVVVVGRENQLAADALLLLAQRPWQLGEEAVQLVRSIVAAEHAVQLVDERALAADEIDPLGDAQQVEILARISVGFREIRRELDTTRQVPVLPVNRLRPLDADSRPRPETAQPNRHQDVSQRSGNDG